MVRVERWPTVVCWLAAAAAATWAVVRIGGLDRVFPLTALMAYTPYIPVLGLAATVFALVMHRRVAAVVILGCSLALLGVVVPRAIPDDPPNPRPDGPVVGVMGANLYQGEADLEAIGTLIAERRVDLVAFAELTPEATARIDASPIGEMLPYSVTDPLDGSAGTGLYSRYPLRRLEAPGVSGNDLPTVRAAVELPGGEAAEAYAIHPVPPSRPSFAVQQRRYLEAIAPAEPGRPPRILAGDFNATLDNSALRDLISGGYTDAADARGAGLRWTWPDRLIPPPVAIDHVIVDSRAEVLSFETAEIPGSDHRAVIASVVLPRSVGE
jgi:endonuclease/exonuclease/phosphatase (EEP) superfamily protein YafD